MLPILPVHMATPSDMTGPRGAIRLEGIGKAFGSIALAQGEKTVAVGRDGRLSGPGLAQAFTRIGRRRLSHFAMCRFHCCPETNC